jgi:hypothetical protein
MKKHANISTFYSITTIGWIGETSYSTQRPTYCESLIPNISILTKDTTLYSSPILREYSMESRDRMQGQCPYDADLFSRLESLYDYDNPNRYDHCSKYIQEKGINNVQNNSKGYRRSTKRTSADIEATHKVDENKIEENKVEENKVEEIKEEEIQVTLSFSEDGVKSKSAPVVVDGQEMMRALMDAVKKLSQNGDVVLTGEPQFFMWTNSKDMPFVSKVMETQKVAVAEKVEDDLEEVEDDDQEVEEDYDLEEEDFEELYAEDERRKLKSDMEMDFRDYEEYLEWKEYNEFRDFQRWKRAIQKNSNWDKFEKFRKWKNYPDFINFKTWKRYRVS